MATGNTPQAVIEDIKTSRNNIAQSIRNKGVSVPTDAKLSDLSAKVSSIVTPNLQSVTVDPNPGGQTIKPDSSHNGLSEVKVNKMASAVAKASGSITNTSATASPGTVSIAKNTTSVSGKTRLDVTPTTSTSGITGSHYMAVQATAAANTTGTSVTASGTASAGISTAGYAPTTLSASANISGTFTAKTSSKSSSVYYLPIPTETIDVTPGENPQSINASSGKLISSVNVAKVPDKYIDTTVSSNAVGSGDIRAGKKAFVNKQLVTGDLPELDTAGTPVLFAPSTSDFVRRVDYDSSNNPHFYRTYPVSFLDNVNPYGNDDVHAGEVITQEVSLKIYEEELGDATAANVLTGTKFTSRDGFAIDGEMPIVDQATPSITVSSTGLITASATQSAGYVSAGTKSKTQQLTTKTESDVTHNNTGSGLRVVVPAGYYGSSVYKFINSTTLKSENIKKDVTIFGVKGTYEGSSGIRPSNKSNVIVNTYAYTYSDLSIKYVRYDYNGNLVEEAYSLGWYEPFSFEIAEGTIFRITGTTIPPDINIVWCDTWGDGERYPQEYTGGLDWFDSDYHYFIAPFSSDGYFELDITMYDD